MKIEIVVGNIVKQPDMEAVVNSANANLRLGSGVAGAIHMAAGPKLEEYCKPFAPLALGAGLITPGFKLANPWILHVLSAHYINNDEPEKYMQMALESMLRLANDIVDVFHRYTKMYVVRPQFFLPIISLLRNAAMNSLQYKSELALVKSQNIDITNFENELDTFKAAFGKNYELASKRFQTAIDEIDKSIDHLQKTKEALT